LSAFGLMENWERKNPTAASWVCLIWGWCSIGPTGREKFQLEKYRFTGFGQRWKGFNIGTVGAAAGTSPPNQPCKESKVRSCLIT
jgi:hypothetical protein